MVLRTVNSEKLSVRAEERRLGDKQQTHGMGLREYIKDMATKLSEKGKLLRGSRSALVLDWTTCNY